MDTRVALRTRISRVRLGGRDLRVIRADRLSPHLYVERVESAHQDFTVLADREAGTQLAAAWALAMRSPHSLIHLPVRSHRPPSEPGTVLHGSPLDIVLVHSALQFRPSAWKEVRARFGTGTPHTARLPELPRLFPEPDADDYARAWHHSHRSHLRFHVAAGTVVVVGDPVSFRFSGWTLRRFVEELPAESVRQPSWFHHCVEMMPTAWRPYDRRDTANGIHLVYIKAGWPPRRATRQRTIPQRPDSPSS